MKRFNTIQPILKCLAFFLLAALPMLLTAESSAAQTLTVEVNPPGSGTVMKDPDKAIYDYGDEVTLTANPEYGYCFHDWSGDISDINNPTTIWMDGDKSVTANFLASDLWFDPPYPNFGTALVGSSSLPTTFTITNTGALELHISSIFLSNTTDFSLDPAGGGTPCGDSYPITLLPGMSCTVSVTFQPQHAATFYESLYIGSDASCPVVEPLWLVGVGAQQNIAAAPQSHNFGNIAVGNPGLQVFTISNTGTYDLQVTGVNITDNVNYVLNTEGGPLPCGALYPKTLLPGNGCTVSVAFSPLMSPAIFNARLSITSDDPDTPTLNIPLSGSSGATGNIWTKIYRLPSSSQYLFLESIQQTADGGFVIAGNSTAGGWVLKLNGDGSVDWQKAYYEFLHSIQQTADGCYIVAGSMAGNAWVLKLDTDGSMLWQKTYGKGSLSSIQKTSDGKYLAAGSTCVSIDCDTLILKINADGSSVWGKHYSQSNNDNSASAVQVLSGGGYIVAGNTSFYYSEDDFFQVQKFRADDSLAWQKKYNGGNGDSAHSIQETTDGGYVVAGMTTFYDSAGYHHHILILKLANDGTITWQKTYGGASTNDWTSASTIRRTSDGGYIVSGAYYSDSAKNIDIWLLKLNADGTIAWQKTYGGEDLEDWAVVDVRETSDGGYVVAAGSNSFGPDYYYLWVLKLDTYGNLTGCPSELVGVTDVSDVSYSGIHDATWGVPEYSSPVVPQDTTLTPVVLTPLEINPCETAPPAGSILINGGTAYATSASVTLTLSASDPIGVSEMCISNIASCTTWESYVTSKPWTLALGDGNKTVYAWFKDWAGNANMSPFSASIILDTVIPSVQITSPSLNPTYATNQSTINIGGTASDANGITQVIWSNDRGGSGTASGTTSWSVTGISLQPGANVINVTAYDAAGNTGTDTLTTNYETVSTPNIPSGPINGVKGISYTYTVGGSTTNPPGHSVQYWIDWGDGTNTGWLSVGTTSTSKIWNAAGPYNVTAKARCATDTVESESSSPLSVTIATSTLVSGTISSNTTWTCANSPYVVTGDVTVNSGVTLTIEPCVVVKFMPGKKIDVLGVLNAQGNSGSKIYFTSVNDHTVGGATGTGTPARGDWGRVFFNGNFTGSGTLDYCVFRYGGTSTYNTVHFYRTSTLATFANTVVEQNNNQGMVVETTANVAVTGCSFLNNTGWGIVYDNNAVNMTNNVFGGNGQGAVIVQSTSGSLRNISHSGNTISADNNKNNGIGIRGYVGIHSEWQGDPNFPYIMLDTLTLYGSYTLTLDPGVVIKSRTTNHFFVEGTLIARGTSGSKIYFTSVNDHTVGRNDTGTGSPAPGDLGTVFFNGNFNGIGDLDHCVFRYGAGGTYSGMIYLAGSHPSLTLSNTTVEKSKQHGLVVDGNATTNSTVTGSFFLNNTYWGIVYVNSSVNLTNNTFGGNGHGAVNVQDGGGGKTIRNISHSGNIISADNNKNNGIGIKGYVGINSQWQADPNFPYIMLDTLTLYGSYTLTLDPGVVIKSRTTNHFFVEGTLIARGTSGSKIYFTSVNDHTIGRNDTGSGTPTSGDWGTVFFNGNYNGIGNLDHCVFRYGAGGTYSGMIYLAGSHPSLTLSNTTFENSKQIGVVIDGASASSVITRGSFINNTTGIYCLNNANPTIGGSVTNQNTFSGNTSYGVYNASTSVTINATYNYWGNNSGPTHVSNPGGSGNRVSDYVNFEPWIGQDFNLQVTKTGEGNGTITSSQAGINCGSDCSYYYDYGTEVTLTASSDSSSIFVSWTGCDSTSGRDCTVNMTSSKTIIATFEMMIDRTVWADLEVFRRINNEVLKSELRRYGSNGSNYLTFSNSGSVISFSADVTLKAYENYGGYPHTSLIGYAYNDGTAGEGHTGDVVGVVGIGHNPTLNRLEGFYSISRCTAANCNLPEEVDQICDGLIDPGFLPSLNTTYPISFSWNGSSFTFTIGGYTKVVDSSNCSDLPSSQGTPRVQMKGIGTRINQIDGADEGGYIAATFDNVYVNGSSYDTFGTFDMIDVTKWWGTLEHVRMLVNDELVSKLTQRGINGTNNMSFVNSQEILAFEADLKVVEFQNNEARPLARLYAALYNDGTGNTTPGDLTGDIAVSVGVSGQGTSPQAFYAVTRCSAPNCNLEGEYEFLSQGFFPVTVALNDTYRFSLSWDGSNVTLSCDGNVISYNPTSHATVAGPPKGRKGVGTRVNEISNASEWAYVSAAFDNVLVLSTGYPLTVMKSGTGTVTSLPSGIDCGSDCGEGYPGGTNVTLTAAADPSSTFSGWSGACTGTGTCTLTMGSAKSVTATFTINQYSTNTAVSDVATTYSSIDQALTLAAAVTSTGGSVNEGTVSFTVKKNSIVIGSPVTSGTVAGGSASAIYTLAGGTPADSYSIEAAYSGGPTFLATTGTGTLTVSQANQTITFGTLADKTFGDPDFTVTATANSGLTVNFTAAGNCTSSGANGFTITITGVGSCTVTAHQGGDANYNPAPDVPQSFNINKASQTITVTQEPPANATYNTSFNVDATAGSGLTVSIGASGACSITGNTITITRGTGACSITFDQGGDANYNPAPQVTRSVTAQRADQTISFGALPDRAYDESPFDVWATASSGLPVSFAIFSGPATVSGSQVTLTGVGTVIVRASQGGDSNWNAAPPVDQSFTVTVGALHHFAIDPISSPQTAGIPFSITITAQDSGNNTVTDYTGTVHFTSTDGQAVLPADYAFVLGDNGSHTFANAVTLKTAGSQTLSVNDTATPAIQETSNAIMVDPASAATFSVSTPTSIIAGHAFDVTVIAKDAFNNTANGYTGTIHLTSSDTHAVLPSNYSFDSGDSGSHTFSFTLETAGSQTVTATDALNPALTGQSGSIEVDPDVATLLSVSAPSSATAGTAFDVTVTTKDAFNNTVTDYTGTLQLTSTDGQAVLPGDYTFTTGAGGDNGSHTFSVTLKTAGPQIVTANDSVHTADSGSILVNTGTATSLAFQTQPTDTAPGQSITPAVTVEVQDDFGNVVESSAASITLAIGTNPGGGTLSGTLTQSSVNGMATFDDLSIDLSGNGYTLVASSTGHTDTTSNPFNLLVGVVAKFEIVTIGTQTVGQAFSITITAQDAGNNTVSSFSQTVDLTTTAGVISPTVSGSFSNGQWTGSVTVTQAGAARTITATRTGGTESGTSNAFMVQKADQTITFGALPEKTYGDADHDPGASASSGLPVSYTSSNPSVATIVAGKIHIVGAGNSTITASQSGDLNFNAAADVSQPFTVNKAIASVTLSNLIHVYDGTPKSAAMTTVPLGLGAEITYNGSPALPVTAGSYSVVATVTDSNYTGSASDTLVIAKSTPVIAWNNPIDITYGTALSAVQLTATANVAGTFVYTPGAGSVLNAGNAQNLHVDFTPTDATNYNNASKDVAVNVLKADTTTSVNSSANPSVQGQAVAFTATVSLGAATGTVQFKIDGSDFGPPAAVLGGTATSGSISTLSKGNHTVEAVYSGDANYNGSTGNLIGGQALANQAPLADDQSVSTDEDIVLDITLTATDPDGDSLNYNIVTGPTYGTLSGTPPNVTYTPNSNYHGSDSFTFKANDGTVDSNIATVSIIINSVNDAPVSVNDTYVISEDNTLSIGAPGVLANDNDVEGDPLTAVLISGPSHASSFTLNPDGSFSYAPNPNFSGTDTFTYKANDGTSDSNVATVTITITGVNDSPIAQNDTYNTPEDTVLNVPVPGVLGNDNDIDGDPLTALLVSNVTHGTLTLNADGSFTYTPDSNYTGTDTFTYKANDGTTDSNVVMVTITVTSVNDSPIANNDPYGTNEDTALTIAASGVLGNDTDVEGNPLTAIKVSDPLHGAVTLNSDGSFTYTPNANFNGNDSFTYKANDGTVDSNVAMVTITVNAVNDAPVTQDQSVSTLKNTPKAITLVATDADGDTLTYSVVANPSHGSLTGTPPNVTYTPNTGYSGPDSFMFITNDGTIDSNEATVSITVTATNEPPVANDQSVVINEDTPKSITLTATDSDGNSLTYSVVTPSLHGALSGTAPNLTYTPDTNYHGPDSFTFKANDGQVDSNIVTVSITVNPINDTPFAQDQSVSTLKNSAKAITLVATDIDGDGLTYSIVLGPAHGALSGTPPNITYTPDPGYSGPDSFTFKANDGTVDSNVVTISITVSSVNDAPVAVNDTYVIPEDNTLSMGTPGVLGNDNDADGDPLTAVLVSGPSHAGSFTLNPDGSFSYIPSANYTGTDSFTYKANDGTGNSNVATVTITITGVNDSPIAQNDSYNTPEDTALNILTPGVLGNDNDIDGDPLTAILVGNVSHGTLSLNADGFFSYIPSANYTGTDTFTYKANDGTTDSNVVMVTITVTSVNDSPVANNDTYGTNEDTVLNVLSPGVLGNDTDVEGNPLTAIKVSDPLYGSVTMYADGSFTYTPNGNFNGNDSFTYKANDGTVNSNVATVTLTITPVNDAPVANADSYSTLDNTPLVVSPPGVLGNDTDVDNNPLTAILISGPTHASSFALNPDGSFEYTPELNFVGTDNFIYKANDGSVDSILATVAIAVIPPEAPLPPVLSSPENGATGIGVTPVLHWNASTGADSYGIQVSMSPGFSSTVINEANLAGTSYTGTPSLSQDTTYYWRVNATNQGGTSGWSSTWNFTTITPGWLSVTPGDGLNSSGTQKGPFSPSSKSYTLQNTGGTAITWSVAKVADWLDLSSPSSGVLNPGASQLVTVSINTNANSLIQGSYNDAIIFVNITNHSGDTSRGLSLTVNVLPNFTISGTITSGGSGLANVALNGLPGNPTTNASGAYSATVPYNWSGTVTPTIVGYSFIPPSATYNNITTNQTQNYVATAQTFILSGYVRTSANGGISEVLIEGLPGNRATDTNGFYSGSVGYGWSGTVAPKKIGYSFTPVSRVYGNVTSDQTQDYTGIRITIHTLTATAGPGGSISPSGSVKVNHGDAQSFTITPDTGYHIVDVKIDKESKGPLPSYTLTDITSNHTISASFAINLYDITVNKLGSGIGTIKSYPSGIDCGSICSKSYNYGTEVELATVPDPKSTFTGWSGACSGTGTCTVTLDSYKTVTATFEESPVIKQFALEVIKSGTGTGIVTSLPSGINCGADCVKTFDAGTDILLTVSPDPGAYVAEVTIDGFSIGGVATVQVPNLLGDHTVEVRLGK